MGALREQLMGIAAKFGVNVEKLLFKFDYQKQTGMSIKQGSHSNLVINIVSPQVTNQIVAEKDLGKSIVSNKEELGFMTRRDLDASLPRGRIPHTRECKGWPCFLVQ